MFLEFQIRCILEIWLFARSALAYEKKKCNLMQNRSRSLSLFHTLNKLVK